MTSARALFVVAGLLIVAAALARINPFRFTGLGDLRPAWLLLAAVGLGVLSVAALLRAVAERGVRRVLLAFGAGCTALAALAGIGLAGLAAAFAAAYADASDSQRVAAVSADGRLTIIVHETWNMIDPVHGLYVQTTDGFFSRRAYLGCRNGDSSQLLASARFVSANTIVVRDHGGQTWTLRFDPMRVRAIDTLPDDFCSQGLYTG